ncbi:hypothetical protein [Pseudoduganella sp. OTU4001]|uniref:hypothetical protein n=1 Tax=Pseudoduganella sp. OTU4001 TaxID=3043854 RepID=UPI00313B5ECF
MPLLRIDVEARVAQFQDAMNAIERSAKKSASVISGSFSSANAALAGLGVGISAGGLAAIVKNAIDAADHLNDLSKKTGIAVETLGGIGFAAKQAGADLDSVAKAMGKFNLQIADAAGGGKETSAAFRALGIEIKDSAGKLRGADELLVDVAKRFEGLEDGPAKAALANKLFTKSYADLLPLLDDGAQSLRDNIAYYQKYSGVTTEIAERSDKFNDALAKIGLLSGAAGNQIAAELLPTMQLLADKMLAVKESSEGFSGVGKAINTVIEGISVLGVNTSYVFKQVGNEIGGIAAQLGALGRLDFKNFERIGQIMRLEAKEAREEVDRIMAEILDPNKGQKAGAGSIPDEIMDALKRTASAPIIPVGGGEDPGRKRLEAQMREVERALDRDRELLMARKEFLDIYYQQDLLSTSEYFAARNAAAQEALQSQQANIEKEIALLKSRKPKDPAERVSNESKIKELQEKSAQLEASYNTEVTRGIIEREARMKDFGRQISEVNLQFIEMQGNLEKVAAARFDTEHGIVSKRLSGERQTAVDAGDTEKVAEIDQAMRQLDMMRAAAVAQGRVNELLVDEARIQSDLQITTERADMAAEAGSITQIEALRKISDARRQAAIDLQAAATAFAAAAANSPDQRLADQAKQFQLAADKMAASADLVRDKMQGVFQNGFESLFDKLISGTMSVKDAFKSLFNEIAADMARMAVKDLGKGIFGDKGVLGGVVKWFSGLFPNANGNAFSAGDIVPFAKGGIPSGIVDAPTFFAMAGGRLGLMGEAGPEAIMPLHRDEHGALSVKMLSPGGRERLLQLGRDSSGSLSVVDRFAHGGVFGAHARSALAAHMPRMPSISVASKAMMAVPMNGSEAQTINNINVQVPAGTSRESADSIASRTAMAIERANRRNN